MRSKYDRISDDSFFTRDECETWTLELEEQTHQQIRDYILKTEPGLLTSAFHLSDATMNRMVDAGLAGQLTGKVCEDVIHGVLLGYVLCRRGADRFIKDLLDANTPNLDGSDTNTNQMKDKESNK